MKISFPNINHLWSWLIIEELLRNGVDYFCLSPGSRSTPLTTAVARQPRARRIVIYDERAAAFHALGYARATGRPAVLICTSGSAPANYFPAIIEAALEDISMIVLSADRPPELRDSGANQTIDQVKMYASYVRWQMDLATPDEHIPAAYVLSIVNRLVRMASGTNPGPVHLNCMFREPLAPEQQPFSETYLSPIQNWIKENKPWTHYHHGQATILPDDLQDIIHVLSTTKRGVIIIGRLEQYKSEKVLHDFLSCLNWPVFPDISSGLRSGGDYPYLIHYYDLMVSTITEPFETVLHLGGRFVSKRLQQFLEKYPPKTYFHVNGTQARLDAGLLVTKRLSMSAHDFCAAIQGIQSRNEARQWTVFLKKISQQVDGKLDELLSEGPFLSQPQLKRIISREIQAQSALFLANSLPVREMDIFAATDGPQVKIAVNRGASGIDGTVATATGFAVGCNKPLTLVIGDLALLHDLNALMLVKQISQPVIVVVVNNHGGGIFHFLPISRFEDIFEEYFATAHDLTFEGAAQMFGLEYQLVQDGEAFSQTYRQARDCGRSVLVEVVTDRQQNVAWHRQIQAEISKIL